MRKLLVIVLALAVLVTAALLWRRKPGQRARVSEDAGAAERSDKQILARMKAARAQAPLDARPAVAAGTVRRAADGAPVQDVVVLLAPKSSEPEESQADPLTTRTDAQGAWEKSDLPPGEYRVSATAPGFVPGAKDDVALAPGQRQVGIDFALEAGGATLAGTVTDVGGGPISAVLVLAQPIGGGSSVLARRAGFAAMTGEDGAYHLDLADGTYMVATQHSDYVGGQELVTIEGKPKSHDFVLTPACVVSGRVLTRSDRQPVPGALVRASGGRSSAAMGLPSFAQGLAGPVVRADDQGRFTVRGLGSGAVELDAVAQGFTTKEPVVVELGIGHQVSDMEVLVDGAFTISGFVIRKDQPAQGLADVSVAGLRMKGGFAATSFDATDAQGYFEILGVEPGTYSMMAMVEGLVPSFLATTVTVRKADVTDVLIVLDTGASLSGRVEPPGPARLSLEMDPETIGLGNLMSVVGASMVRGLADKTGQFTLAAVPNGKFDLVAKADDGRKGKLAVEIDGQSQSGLLVRLESRASVAGRVLDATGAPVEGLRVRLEPKEPKKETLDFAAYMEETGRTANDGTFKVLGLDPGKYSVTVRDEDGPLAWADAAPNSWRYASMDIELATGEERKGLELRVESKAGTIRGVVLGPDREPVPDAWVVASIRKQTDWELRPGSESKDADDERHASREERPVLTGEDGRFVIKRLRQGTYDVTAEGLSGAAFGQKKGVRTGEQITIRLEPLAALEGTVTASGQPVQEFQLTVDGPMTHDKRISDPEGRYQMDRLGPGPYKVKVNAEAGAALGDVVVPPGKTAHLDLEIQAWGSVSGTLVDATTGKPLSGTLVIARSKELHDDAELASAVLSGGGPKSDGQGRFTVAKVGPGKGTLLALDAGLLGGIELVAVRDFTLELGQALDLGTLRGLKTPKVPEGERGDLGLDTRELDDKLVVERLRQGGPAMAAGIVPLERIIAVDGFTTEEFGADTISKLLEPKHLRAGQKVKVTVLRKGKPQDVDVVASKPTAE